MQKKVYIVVNNDGKCVNQNLKGEIVFEDDETLGFMWETKEKALNFLDHTIQEKGDFFVKEIFISECSDVKIKEDVVREISEIPPEEFNTEKWIGEIRSLSELITEIEDKKKVLISSLSKIDKEINDIRHYIEFGKFNAYQGWCSFKMLQNTLKRRRVVKNEIDILKKITDSKINSKMLDKVIDYIPHVQNKKYIPRVHKELFK